MVAELLLAFTIGGGIPPANGTFLEIYRDGRAVLLVGNALAEGEPQDEAGLYQMTLSTPDVKSIEDFISTNRMFDLGEEYGPIRADSGFYELYLHMDHEERKTRWGPFAKTPQAVRELQTRLSELSQSARQHQVQVVGATLGIVEQVTVGHGFLVEFSIRNRGSEAVQVLMSTEGNAKPTVFKLHAAASESATSRTQGLANLYQQAQYISTMEFDDPSIRKDSIKLSPGAEITMHALSPFILDAPGSYKLYGFVGPVLEVMVNGKPIPVECFFATRPVTVDVR